MAATQLLATGNTPALSPEFAVVSGDPVSVLLKEISGPCTVNIEMKDDAGGFTPVANLSDHIQSRAVTIAGPGTYRVSRTSGSCGVSRG